MATQTNPKPQENFLDRNVGEISMDALHYTGKGVR